MSKLIVEPANAQACSLAFPFAELLASLTIDVMSVEELESNVARLPPEELERFSQWFDEFTDQEEQERRRKAVAEVDSFRAEMKQKYGMQPSSVDLVREARDNPRA